MNYLRRPLEKESKVTHVATRHATWKGMGKPFPLHPKPDAEHLRGLA